MNDPFEIRPIARADNPGVARVIRTVMPEFGASGPGFAIHDPEVDAMFEQYTRPRHAYFVVARGAEVVGGAGVGPLTGADPAICELRKMYFLPEARGRGLGEQLLRRCLDAARELGFKTCYLETLTGMDAAQKLYMKLGFRQICGPLGATGHFSCDRFFSLELT
jgi:putative acetyltransferase